MANATRRVCLTAFGLLFAVQWLGWIAQMTGQPAALWNLIHASVPSLAPQFQAVPFSVALLFTA